MKLEIVFKDGRKETFDNVASFNEIKKQTANKKCQAFKVAQIPAEGKLFEVNPLGIDRSKFEKPRINEHQEWTRQTILSAFAVIDKHPKEYAFAFYTLIPKKKWNGFKTIGDMYAYADRLGGRMADWVEQALEWAQRISNGESWNTVCNIPDTAKCYRMVTWMNGVQKTIGGSSPSSMSHAYYRTFDRFLNYVPLIVLMKE